MITGDAIQTKKAKVMKRFLALVGLSLFILTATYATDRKAPAPFADVGVCIIEQAVTNDAVEVITYTDAQYGMEQVSLTFQTLTFAQDATEYGMYVAMTREVDLSATSEPPSAITMKNYAKESISHYSLYKRRH